MKNSMITNYKHFICRLVLTLTVVITMAMWGCSSTPEYTFIPTLSSITIKLTTAVNLAMGSRQQLTAIGTYSNGSSSDITYQVTWRSSDISKATISSTGLATGVASGTTDITASMVGITSPNITLMVGATTLSSITITPEKPLNLAVHTAQQFTATGIYSDGSNSDITSQATWTSSAATTAIFHYPGLASGVTPGSTNITASLSGVTSSAVTLTVVTATELSSTTSTATPKTTATTTTSATKATTKPTYTTTPTSTTKPKLSSITVTANQIAGFTSTYLRVGLSQQYTATGTYSNGSTADITSQVTWKSSSTTIATISSSGVAIGIAAGTTDITASMSGITSSALTLKVESR
jgi:trimeric autotransporter adhesin